MADVPANANSGRRTIIEFTTPANIDDQPVAGFVDDAYGNTRTQEMLNPPPAVLAVFDDDGIEPGDVTGAGSHAGAATKSPSMPVWEA